MTWPSHSRPSFFGVAPLGYNSVCTPLCIGIYWLCNITIWNAVHHVNSFFCSSVRLLSFSSNVRSGFLQPASFIFLQSNQSIWAVGWRVKRTVCCCVVCRLVVSVALTISHGAVVTITQLCREERKPPTTVRKLLLQQQFLQQQFKKILQQQFGNCIPDGKALMLKMNWWSLVLRLLPLIALGMFRSVCCLDI